MQIQLPLYPGSKQYIAELTGSSLTIRSEDVHAADEIFLLSDIQKVRLNSIVGTSQTKPGLECALTWQDGVKRVMRVNKSDPEQMKIYRRFQKELHQTLSRLPARPEFTSGAGSNATYQAIFWGFLITFSIMGIAAIYGMSKKGETLIGIIFLTGLGFCAFVLMKWIQKMLKPRAYDPENIPLRFLS